MRSPNRSKIPRVADLIKNFEKRRGSSEEDLQSSSQNIAPIPSGSSRHASGGAGGGSPSVHTTGTGDSRDSLRSSSSASKRNANWQQQQQQQQNRTYSSTHVSPRHGTNGAGTASTARITTVAATEPRYVHRQYSSGSNSQLVSSETGSTGCANSGSGGVVNAATTSHATGSTAGRGGDAVLPSRSNIQGAIGAGSARRRVDSAPSSNARGALDTSYPSTDASAYSPKRYTHSTYVEQRQQRQQERPSTAASRCSLPASSLPSSGATSLNTTLASPASHALPKTPRSIENSPSKPSTSQIPRPRSSTGPPRQTSSKPYVPSPAAAKSLINTAQQSTGIPQRVPQPITEKTNPVGQNPHPSTSKPPTAVPAAPSPVTATSPLNGHGSRHHHSAQSVTSSRESGRGDASATVARNGETSRVSAEDKPLADGLTERQRASQSSNEKPYASRERSSSNSHAVPASPVPPVTTATATLPVSAATAARSPSASSPEEAARHRRPLPSQARHSSPADVALQRNDDPTERTDTIHACPSSPAIEATATRDKLVASSAHTHSSVPLVDQSSLRRASLDSSPQSSSQQALGASRGLEAEPAGVGCSLGKNNSEEAVAKACSNNSTSVVKTLDLDRARLEPGTDAPDSQQSAGGLERVASESSVAQQYGTPINAPPVPSSSTNNVNIPTSLGFIKAPLAKADSTGTIPTDSQETNNEEDPLQPDTPDPSAINQKLPSTANTTAQEATLTAEPETALDTGSPREDEELSESTTVTSPHPPLNSSTPTKTGTVAPPPGPIKRSSSFGELPQTFVESPQHRRTAPAQMPAMPAHVGRRGAKASNDSQGSGQTLANVLGITHDNNSEDDFSDSDVSEANSYAYLGALYEMSGIEPLRSDDDSMDDGGPIHYHKPTKLRFSEAPLRVCLTWAKEDYERRGEGIDPLAATAQYELEKRIAKMDTFDVTLQKDDEYGLGIAIIGMGVGADAGMEKLGIFIKRVTENGAAARTGNIRIGDMITEVDGISLVGVTQAFAGHTLYQTGKTCKFSVAREKSGHESEIQELIKQSLEMDRMEEERTRVEEEREAARREQEERRYGDYMAGDDGFMFDEGYRRGGGYEPQAIQNTKSSNQPPNPDMFKDLISSTEDTKLMIDLAVAQESQKLITVHEAEVRQKNDRITQLETALHEERQLTQKLKVDLDLKLSLLNKNRERILELQKLTQDLTAQLTRALAVNDKLEEKVKSDAAARSARQTTFASTQAPMPGMSPRGSVKFCEPAGRGSGQSSLADHATPPQNANTNNSNNRTPSTAVAAYLAQIAAESDATATSLPETDTTPLLRSSRPASTSRASSIQSHKTPPSACLTANPLPDASSHSSSTLFANTTINTPSGIVSVSPAPATLPKVKQKSAFSEDSCGALRRGSHAQLLGKPVGGSSSGAATSGNSENGTSTLVKRRRRRRQLANCCTNVSNVVENTSNSSPLLK